MQVVALARAVVRARTRAVVGGGSVATDTVGRDARGRADRPPLAPGDTSSVDPAGFDSRRMPRGTEGRVRRFGRVANPVHDQRDRPAPTVAFDPHSTVAGFVDPASDVTESRTGERLRIVPAEQPEPSALAISESAHPARLRAVETFPPVGIVHDLRRADRARGHRSTAVVRTPTPRTGTGRISRRTADPRSRRPGSRPSDTERRPDKRRTGAGKASTGIMPGPSGVSGRLAASESQ